MHRTIQIFADHLEQHFNYHFQCLCDPRPQDYFEYLFYADLEGEGLNFFPSLIASSYVDDLLNTHVLTCASVITSQLWRFLAPVITELFTHRDAKMKYGNRLIKTELCIVLVTDQLNAQILVL